MKVFDFVLAAKRESPLINIKKLPIEKTSNYATFAFFERKF